MPGPRMEKASLMARLALTRLSRKIKVSL